MGVYSGIRPHELADLRAVADRMLDTPAGERMHALLDAYEEMQDPDEIVTLEQVEPLVVMVGARFDQAKKIHALLDEDEKARQEKEKTMPPKKTAPAQKTAGEVVEDLDAKLEGLEEALDELQASAEDLGPVCENKALYYGALEDILAKQAELNAELEKLNEFAEVEDMLLELAESGDMEAARMFGHKLSQVRIVELAKAWKLARDFAEHVRDTAGAHV